MQNRWYFWGSRPSKRVSNFLIAEAEEQTSIGFFCQCANFHTFYRILVGRQHCTGRAANTLTRVLGLDGQLIVPLLRYGG